MRSRNIVVAIALLALLALACQAGGLRQTVRGSGTVVEEQRPIRDLSAVTLATRGTLHVDVGERATLRVEADDNVLRHIETTVRGYELVIGLARNVELRDAAPIHYYLTVTRLDEIALTSSGDAVLGDLRAERFTVRLSSSGDLQMGDLACTALDVEIASSGQMSLATLDAERLDVRIKSSGDLDIAAGSVERQEIAISSSGVYRAPDLASDRADVRLSSSGSATVRVRERLTAHLSSSGDVRYLGDPAVEETTTSSGRVIRAGE